MAISIALPVGMLPPLDRHLVPASIPLDPFFLFLLPGTVSWPPAMLWIGATGLLAPVVFLPWVSGVKSLDPIAVIDERCIGCSNCVVDCPYQALEMVPRDEGPHQLLAVAAPERCVSCGICIGSCPTKALQLGGLAPGAVVGGDSCGRPRHAHLRVRAPCVAGVSGREGEDRAIIPLP